MAGTANPIAIQPGRPLPRGRNALPREVVLESQSERVLRALVEAVAERGYAATRVADIVIRAGVSRGTFYQQFRDKEDAFLAAYVASSHDLLATVDAAAVEVADDPLAPLQRGTRAYLAGLAAEPAWSRTFIVEIRAVAAADGPRQEVHDLYVERMRRWRGWAAAHMQVAAIPDHAYEACVDAINELVGRFVVRNGPEELLSLEPAILYIQLALLGFAEAAAAVGSAQQGPS